MSILPKVFGHDKKLERFFCAVDFLEWKSRVRRCEEGPRVWLLVDIGARVTKIELVSREGVICEKKLKMGGDDMDNAIMMYMRTVRRCCIDRRMAELVKAKVGSAWELDSDLISKSLDRMSTKASCAPIGLTPARYAKKRLQVSLTG